MAHETTSKNMDGITDLVVVAPIREGFIHAYENVSYATRLRIVAEGLNRVRVAAREHEKITPFSDVTQRILTLLDFRVGVIDKDLFAFPHMKDKDKWRLQSRRFLYLTATFDGAWEPYMRLIWDPLGPFLDLLFCNCEDYVTASEHSFDEYAQWVRDNQMDSAIFYAATGLTVRDQLYLSKLEHLQRSGNAVGSDLALARLTMSNPERAAAAERKKALTDLAKKDFAQYQKIHELALEALTVLYRLADFYPPEWLAKLPGLREGRYLARVAKDLLLGWEELIPTTPGPLKDIWDHQIVPAYLDPLHWYESGTAYLRELETQRTSERRQDRPLERSEVQGGLLKAQGCREAPMLHGVLMMMTISDADAARAFIRDGIGIHYTEGDGSEPSDGFYRTIGFTADGLRRIGVEACVLDQFPKEFREGMEIRSGLLGDMRDNHPRNWQLPKRNWPPHLGEGSDPGRPKPPVELSEIDFVIQVRTSKDDRDALIAEMRRLEALAANGATLQSYQLMLSKYEGDGISRDVFGFHDGISQPRPVPGIDDTYHRGLDEVRLGELLLGYRNDRSDDPPTLFGPTFPSWRQEGRRKALDYQLNGSFLAIRKLQQHADAFETFIATETARINQDHPDLAEAMTPARLKAKLIGRYPDGQPLIPTSDGSLNNFGYDGDEHGDKCPFAAHIRRANPRNEFQGRPSPRMVRRGMSFDESDSGGGKGLVFMAYNASLAEQYETIQRWINGGNSTDIAAAHNDPIFGVAPKSGALDEVRGTFRFTEGNSVIRVTMPEPFVSLHWGLYLFVPSRSALAKLCALEGGYQPLEETHETRGREVIERMEKIEDPETRGQEWKRLLEDFDAKDPAEKNISPDVWSAIRYYRGGSIKISGPPAALDWNIPPSSADQPMVLSATYRHVMQVLSDWKTYSTEEQLRRIEGNSGPIFVTQQPDDVYKSADLQGKYNYRKESEATNEILMAYDQDYGFNSGYEAGREILSAIQERVPKSRDYYKLELRRQYVLPALGALCRRWYGLPDKKHMHPGGWIWEQPADRTPPGARCPGDFLSPSRNAFYPRPSETVTQFADVQGKAILAASRDFVAEHRSLDNGAATGSIAKKMFSVIEDDEVLARNLIGTMVGAIPPMDGNLRSILLEWLTEKTLWRHQAALHRALGGKPASSASELARAVLYGPVSQAMCKRPAPDLLYRTATGKGALRARGRDRSKDIAIEERDIVVVSLVSAAQRSLHETPYGDVSIVFGGKRASPYQSDVNDREHPVHACPARDMAMGAIMGILAALLDAGRIQALPASLIVRISDWPPSATPPAQ